MEYPKNIKPQEIPAFNFLCKLDQGIPVYEPYIPGPDFLLDGIIAIETTLLEQCIEYCGFPVKIEENYRRIHKYLLSLFSKIDDSYSGHTYFVHIEYTAGVKSLSKKIKNEIKNELEAFVSTTKSSSIINISNKIIFDIQETNPVHGRVLVLGFTYCNEQEGCSITYVKEIGRCLDEKNWKAASWFKSYQIRWLILLDNIGYGLDDLSVEIIRSQIRDLGLFHKIIIINQQSNPLLII